jgi:hypothetical protein
VYRSSSSVRARTLGFRPFGRCLDVADHGVIERATVRQGGEAASSLTESNGTAHAGLSDTPISLSRSSRQRHRFGFHRSRRPRTFADAGDEIVLSEAEAARLLRLSRRSVDLVEVIDDVPELTKKKLPG